MHPPSISGHVPANKMSLLRNLLLGVLLLSLVVFIALFGQLPALRRTPVGWLQRALCLHIPNGLRRVDTRLTGGTITRSSRRLGHYLFYQKNPTVLVRASTATTASMAPSLITLRSSSSSS